jgi:hypothetical protein
MDRFKFIQPRLGFEVGRIVDESTLRLGIIRTLVSMRVLEKVEDGKQLDDQENVEPKRASAKSSGSKSSSTSKPKRSNARRKPKSSD